MHDEMEFANVYEIAAALGHDVCETCQDQVCRNPGHTGCAYDGPGYVTPDGSLVFCQACDEAARLEDEPTQVEPIPLACDVEETTPIRHEKASELAQKMDRRHEGVPEPRKREAGQWLWAILVLAAGIAGLAVTPGCATAPAPVQVEAVGTLAAGPSVYSAPVHETTPPPSFELAGSADDDAGEVATTVTRVGDTEAPAVVAKDQGLTLGTVR